MSVAIPTIFTIALLSSLVSFPSVFEPFKSFPLMLTILFAYFTLIPKWLRMPPFFSSAMLRHKLALSIIGLILLLIALYDLISGFGASLPVQRVLASLGLPMSSFLVSNLTYFIILTTRVLSYIVGKSRQRVKVDLQWYMKLLSSFKPVAYLPPPRMMKKGFPILIRNKSTNALVITNIRLTTIIGYPLFVPYAVTKAFLSKNAILSRTADIDEELDMPKKVGAKEEEIIYIPWNAFEKVAKKLSGQVDFSKTVAMSYIRLYDEFVGKKWDTRTFHVLTPLFISKMPEILRR